MDKIKAVIFDMDGVIFDTERLIRDCWVELGAERGLSADDIERVFTACTGTNKEKTKETVLNAFGRDFPYDEFSKTASGMFAVKTAESGIPVKKGVRETLAGLKEMGMPIGLASSTRLQIVSRELGDAGLLDYFDVVIGGDLLKKSKPEPDIYLLACEKIGYRPEECVAVEDSYNGITSAYRAGLHPVMIPDLLAPNERMKAMSDAVLDSMEEFIGWFKENTK